MSKDTSSLFNTPAVENVPPLLQLEINNSAIPAVAAQEQPSELRNLTAQLGVGVYDQHVLERGVMEQVEKAMAEKEEELDRKRLVKTQNEARKIERRIAQLEEKMNGRNTAAAEAASERVSELEVRLADLREEENQIRTLMAEKFSTSNANESSSTRKSSEEPGRLGNESHRDMLIRTGKITPFEQMQGLGKSVHGGVAGAEVAARDGNRHNNEMVVSRNLIAGDQIEDAGSDFGIGGEKAQVKGKGKAQQERRHQDDDGEESNDVEGELSAFDDGDDDEYVDDDGEATIGTDEISINSQEEVSDYTDDGLSGKSKKHISARYRGQRKDEEVIDEVEDAKRRSRKRFDVMDDGNEMEYQKRLVAWARKRRLRRAGLLLSSTSAEDVEDMPDPTEQEIEEEIHLPHPVYETAEFDGGFAISGDVYSKLFEYQKTCSKWLWELHCQGAGGIIGDEMGLGKTIQIISFLSGLHHSRMMSDPVLVICPATVMKQWVKEFHRWWPPLRVVILHTSGSGMVSGIRREQAAKGSADETDETSESKDETEEVEEEWEEDRRGKRETSWHGRGRRRGGRGTPKKPRQKKKKNNKNDKAIEGIVDRVFQDGHVLITTYAGTRTYRKHLIPRRWSYVILDEGHKIRNPDADVTLTIKQFKTPHRIILSGTPIQNNLTELWSLFDFVFPGRLGTLPVFQSQFAVPINIGGYANASNIQVQTAYKCACVLRDLINPYLLRRMKADVASDLPRKSEQVLFCKLTPIQRKAYENFLKGDELESIMAGKRQVLYGIDVIRKICNHPDLLNRDVAKTIPDYGDWQRSGKMLVVKALLEMWHRENHRVLLFSQTRQMLDILETFCIQLKYAYRRMDGTTPVAIRHALVDEFNARKDIYIFLLTTKVGGLGVNLIGANRVCIFDPDWNPSTDIQARERAWRLGQKKDVTIYRLMTSGTIEEKIYHRQIFKTFLTNKILKDPKQKRFFKSSDLNDLFSLSSAQSNANGTETGELFEGTEVLAPRNESTTRKRAPADAFENGDGAPVERKRSKKDRGRNKDDMNALRSIRDLDSVVPYRPPITTEDGMTQQDVPSADDVESISAEDTGNQDESHILTSLFEMTGIHSALKHDSIVDSMRQEEVIVEREATRVANQAIAALKESRRKRRRDEVGVPTWTGRHGSAGGPRFGTKTARSFLPGTRPSPASTSPRANTSQIEGFGSGSISGFRGVSGAASSSSLLRKMRERSSAGDGRGSDQWTAPVDGSEKSLDEGSREGLIVKIRDFLYERGGRATSGDIVANFKLRIKDEDVSVFRKMLKGIACFEREDVADVNGAKKGWWNLKREFV